MDRTALLPLAVLAVLAASALVHDVLFRRIPNTLVLAGMALGFLFQACAPDGTGLFSGGAGQGPVAALLGALTGLALFLPFYVLRVMGAGDVKLLAMIGVWFGPAEVAWAALWTLLAGGVLSIVAALVTGSLKRVLVNLYVMLLSRTLMPVAGAGQAAGETAAGATATGRLPYALAIVIGMVVSLVRMHLG